MNNIIFIAPPAAGKGTQSDLLVKKYGYTHISTGDLLRSEVASGSELGNSLKEIMSSGSLVSDEIVTTLLRNKLSSLEGSFILDGYPRTLEQAKTLSNLADELGIVLNTVIYLEMNETTAMHRALGRITCPKCKRGYNKFEELVKPKVENICDDCNVELESRSDDTEETFKVRFSTYVEKTSPVLDYYKNLGKLEVIDANIESDEVFKIIEEMLGAQMTLKK